MAVSDMIVVMRNAEIAQTGTPEELYRRPKTVFVAAFMGEANAVKATIVEARGDQAIVDLAGLRLTTVSNGLLQGTADLVIRPEAIGIGIRAKRRLPPR